ncbi:MAG: peptidoglycan editing factor PgeF [Alphaproteobacteria bacterium]|nr:peptidoglycan editing factor PgeF [Alphaproteobacteria bacterium]
MLFPLTSSNLDLPHIRHGFFSRSGGVSQGIYASLNCGPGSGDNLEHVGKNRQRVSSHMGAPLITCHQVHSSEAVTVEAPWQQGQAPQADAMVTNQPGIALGILTADCLPVLFADRSQRIIGAAHAGWKGAFTGVLENTIAAMKALGASDIACAIGPAISQPSYEVGPEFYEKFTNNQQPTTNNQFFIPSSREGHHLFDLKGYALARLKNVGIEAELLDRDTCFEDDSFFSFRRATLIGERGYGRQVSVITLT